MDDLFPENPSGDNRLKNINKTAQHGAYAWFPGTGPEGRTCRTCEHVWCKQGDPRGRNAAGFQHVWGVCGKYAALKGERVPACPKIKLNSAACREYEPGWPKE